MASTVVIAFDEFMKYAVNLDPSQVSSAISSRDWLLGQIQTFPNSDLSFPALQPRYSTNHIAFGSFARKTKTRPLDDIDLMVCMNADGCQIMQYSHDNIELHLPTNYSGRLANYRHTTLWNNHKVSSTRIVNKFTGCLSNVSQYGKAEIKRNGEAATLKLISYDWNFDIVPCFITDGNFYLIPNGLGHWKKTDPRIDRDRLQRINQACNGNVLRVIRALKYWNQRPYKVGISSYLLETMISNYYDNEISCYRAKDVTKYVDMEIVKVFEYLKNNIFYTVNNPKGIAGNINNIGYDAQYKMQLRISTDLEKSKAARAYEKDSKHKESINKWREVFGDLFPQFT